jgi:hypothetical protein
VVAVQIVVFSVVKPWRLVGRYRRPGGKCCLHLQGLRVQGEESFGLYNQFLTLHISNPEYGRTMFLRNGQYSRIILHDVTSQKTAICTLIIFNNVLLYFTDGGSFTKCLKDGKGYCKPVAVICVLEFP